MNEESIAPNFWEKRYRDQHTPWDRGSLSPALRIWLDENQVPAGNILVPGCGYGHEVIELCARGFQVTAIDIARSALDRLGDALERQGLSASLVCADFLDWKPKQGFDSIYEQTSLCALPPDLWPGYVRQLENWLKPGGVLLALFMQTGKPGGPPWHCDPIAMQRLFKPPMWTWAYKPTDPISHPAGFYEQPAILNFLPS